MLILLALKVSDQLFNAASNALERVKIVLGSTSNKDYQSHVNYVAYLMMPPMQTWWSTLHGITTPSYHKWYILKLHNWECTHDRSFCKIFLWKDTFRVSAHCLLHSYYVVWIVCCRSSIFFVVIVTIHQHTNSRYTGCQQTIFIVFCSTETRSC